MGKYLIFIACLLLTNVLMAQSELTIEQREKAEMCVERYFKMLARYANHPMGAEAAELRTDIIMMCENKFRTPVIHLKIFQINPQLVILMIICCNLEFWKRRIAILSRLAMIQLFVIQCLFLLMRTIMNTIMCLFM